MFKYHLFLQENPHPRDFVYEVSSLYLIARSFHLAMQLDLPHLISESGISINRLTESLSDYDAVALRQLMEFLALYKFFAIKEGKIFPTPFSRVAMEFSNDFQVNVEEWNDCYHLLEYLNKKPQVMQKFSSHLTIKIENNSIYYEALQPEEILNELFYGHLLSRAILLFTTSGMAEIINSSDVIILNQINPFFKIDETITEFNLSCLFKLLDRYSIVKYDAKEKSVAAGEYLPYLLEQHPESISKAMDIITKPWWFAAAVLEKSFLKVGKSAFEFANNKTFYDEYIKNDANNFMGSMAAISLLEDQNVCDALAEHLSPFETIVDIGGGDAALLKKIHKLFPNKQYILFEKIPNECTNISAAEQELTEKIQFKHGKDFNVTVVLGDFTKPFVDCKIPQCINAAYIVKCVLHNIAEKEVVISILKNIQRSLGRNSEFFLAERIVPDNLTRPHLNAFGILLMRMLFKAEARKVNFYKEVLSEANFASKESNETIANNYLVFSKYFSASPVITNFTMTV